MIVGADYFSKNFNKSTTRYTTWLRNYVHLALTELKEVYGQYAAGPQPSSLLFTSLKWQFQTDSCIDQTVIFKQPTIA